MSSMHWNSCFPLAESWTGIHFYLLLLLFVELSLETNIEMFSFLVFIEDYVQNLISNNYVVMNDEIQLFPIRDLTTEVTEGVIIKVCFVSSPHSNNLVRFLFV
jgi:hypothetical protein